MSAGSPLEAVAAYLDLPLEEVPLSLRTLCEQFEREHGEAERHVCDCCGFKTLLNPGYYEICVVCGWEDDRSDTGRRLAGPDAPSGPNGISLTQARANFQEFGAVKEANRQRVRRPGPDEQPSA